MLFDTLKIAELKQIAEDFAVDISSTGGALDLIFEGKTNLTANSVLNAGGSIGFKNTLDGAYDLDATVGASSKLVFSGAVEPADPAPPPPVPLLFGPNPPGFPCGGKVGGVFPEPPPEETLFPFPPPEPPGFPATVAPPPYPPPAEVIVENTESPPCVPFALFGEDAAPPPPPPTVTV